MTLQTLMQAVPAKANELFTKLSETSDGAVKTREKLFTDLKAELELHTTLEEQHLFPILRRNAETKELVSDAIKDNRELRSKLAEIEGLPKNDDAFPNRLKELRKTFRQHARDDKRELLPAVQRTLNEAQVQGITQRMEAGIAQAEQARHDEQEERRVKDVQEREQATAHAEQQAAIRRAQDEAKHQVRATAEAVTRAAATTHESATRMAEGANAAAQRINHEIRGAAETYAAAMKAVIPDPRAIASLPGVAASALNEIGSASVEWMRQTTQAGTRISQELLGQAAEQQRQFAAHSVRQWMEYNARVMQITMHMTQESVRRMSTRSMGGADVRRSEH